jgi:hypothetical protein
MVVHEVLAELESIRADVTGFVLLVDSPLAAPPEVVEAVKQAWLEGTALLAVGPAIEVLGAYYCAEEAAGDSFSIEPGFDLVNIMLDPQVVDHDAWKELHLLTSAHPDLLALGIPRNTAVIIDQDEARVRGDGQVMLIDLRLADGPGSSGDIRMFSNGQRVQENQTPTPTLTASPTRTDTPEPTETQPPTEAPRATSTRTPRPTSTPLTIPPPSDPETSRIMVAFGVLAVIVVIVGLWLNRKNTF